MVLIKNRNKIFWKKKLWNTFNGNSSLKSEKVQRREVFTMKIISLESKYACFIAKSILFLLTITLKYTLFPLSHSYFPKYSLLRKM